MGESPRGAMWTVTRDGLTIVAAGLAAGPATAVAVGRLLQGVLYGVAPADPVVFGAVTGVTMAVSFVATYLPARRAARLEPMAVLTEG